ncbi:MAG: metallophosphoesterase [Nocardioidaceae bacterium]|jgi:predicted MPP superfamily phosphohydrolase
MRSMTSVLSAVTALGIGTLGYAAGVECRAYTLRRTEVPVLAPGSRPLRVLHLSDVHMTPGQTGKQRWLRELADVEPDLVVNTGDNLAHQDSVPVVLDAYRGLLDVPGVFVLGSNDYFAPVLKNPARYLLSNQKITTPDEVLPWRELRDSFTGRGWLDLTNRHGSLQVAGRRICFVGVDDPHLGYDDLAAVAGTADPGADLNIAVAHAPYLRLLDQWNREGYRLLMAGHTHGGQLRLPGFGALVTNCDLDRARARGLHRHRVDGHEPSWLHVSAGLGTSPLAPVRFCCRPEASLLTLVARRPDS